MAPVGGASARARARERERERETETEKQSFLRFFFVKLFSLFKKKKTRVRCGIETSSPIRRSSTPCVRTRPPSRPSSSLRCPTPRRPRRRRWLSPRGWWPRKYEEFCEEKKIGSADSMVTTHFPPLKEPLNASPSFLPLFSLLFTSLSVTFFMIKQERKGEKSNGREREMKPSINRATPRLPPTQKPRSTLPKKKLSTQKKKRQPASPSASPAPRPSSPRRQEPWASASPRRSRARLRSGPAGT